MGLAVGVFEAEEMDRQRPWGRNQLGENHQLKEGEDGSAE